MLKKRDFIRQCIHRALSILPFLALFLLIASSPAMPESAPAETPILKLDTGGHMAKITKIVAMRDGRHIISASDDKTIRIWDTETGQETTKILGQIGSGSEGMIYAIALIPDKGIRGQVPDKLVPESSNQGNIRGQAPDRLVPADSKQGWLAVGGFLDKPGHGESGNIRIYDLNSGVLIKALKSHEDVVFDLAVSTDGRYLVSGSADTTVKVWDITNNFNLVHTFEGHTNSVCAVRILRSGRDDNPLTPFDKGDLRKSTIDKGNYKIVSAGNDNKVILWSLNDKKMVNSYTHSDKLDSIAVSESYIAVSGDGNKINIFDHNLKRIKEIESETIPAGLSFSPDGRLLLAGLGSPPPVCNIYDSQKGFEKITSFKKHDNLTQAVTFLNNRTAVTGGGDNYDIYLWDAYTGEVKRQISGHGKPVWSVGIRGLPSNASIGGREIAFGNTWLGGDTHTNTTILEKSINLESYTVNNPLNPPLLRGTKLTQAEGYKRINTVYQGYSLAHAAGGDYGYQDAVLLIKKNGNEIGRIARNETDGYGHNTYGFTGDGTIISGGMNGRLTAYNNQGTQIASFIGHTGEVEGIAIDGDALVSGSSDQTIRLWNLKELKNLKSPSVDYERLKRYAEKWGKQTGKKWTIEDVKKDMDSAGLGSEYLNAPEIKPIVSIFVSDDDNWIVWTEEGFFNASSGGAKYIGYHINRRPNKEAGFVTVDKLYDTFYRPDLVEARLNGKDISGYARDINIANLLKGGLPPRVEMITPSGTSQTRDIKLKARLYDTGGGIGDITLFLNDVPISIERSGRGMKIMGKEDPASSNWYNFEWLISLQPGANRVGIMAYNKGNTMESNRPEIELVYKSQTIEKPDLHIMTIAIDQYRDIDLRLKYSINDAKGIVETIKQRSAPLFKDIHVYAVNDNDATKANIQKRFEGIRCSTEDVFLLFIAGHGITYERDGGYYYLPVDFRYTSDESIPEQGVSMDDFKRCLTNVKAMKSLLLVDTCNSGSFADAVSSRGMLEKTAINKLTRAIGRAMIVASSKDQVAMEGYEGHGVFTYTVLNAMNGLERYRNNQITVSELAAYIEETLPELTLRKWGYEQIPQKNLQGMDFPIGVK